MSRVISVLTENEWNSPETRLLILERLSRLENELADLKKYRSSYHEKAKESAVLRQKLRQATTAKMLFDFCLAAGGVLVGLSTVFFDNDMWILGFFVILMGLGLLVSSLLLKHHQKAH